MGVGVVSCAAMHATGKAGEAQLISNAALREGERAKRYARPTRSIIIRKNQPQSTKQCLPAWHIRQPSYVLRTTPTPPLKFFPWLRKKQSLTEEITHTNCAGQ